MSLDALGPAPAVSLEVYGQMPARKALAAAGQTGYRAVGLPAWKKDLSPAHLGASGMRDLGVFLAKNGFAASWLSAGPRGRFTVAAALEEDIEAVSRLLSMAAVVRPGAVVACVGPLGAKESDAAATAAEALRVLAEGADAAGVPLALAASGSEERTLESMLAELPGAPLGLVFDPGAALFAGRDPVDACLAAAGIAAVRASDCSGEERDLPPGEGRVAWRDFLAALAARDYHGYVTVEFAPRPQSAALAASALKVLQTGAI